MVSLATVRLLTELLNADEVGQYYLLLTLLALFNFVVFNPFGQYYSRCLIRWKHQGDILNATFVVFILRLLGTLLCLGILVPMFIALDYARYYTLPELLTFFLFSLLAGFHGVLLSAINILGDRIRFAIIGSLTLLLGLSFSLVIVGSISERAIGWLYGVAMSQILFSIVLFKYLVRDSALSIEKIKAVLQSHNLSSKLYFLVPVALTLFLQWGQNISYRIVIEAKYSVEILAYLGLGMAIARNIFNTVESLVNQVYMPSYLRSIAYASYLERSAAWNQLTFYVMPIYIVLAIFALSTSFHLPVILTSEEFYSISLYIALGVVAEFLRVSANLVYMVSQSEMKTTPTMMPYIIGFLLTIASLLAFDLSNNIWLIAVLISIAYGVLLLLLWASMRRLLGIKINLPRLTKAAIASLPLLILLAIPAGSEESTVTFIISLSTVAIGCAYFCLVVYLMMRSKLPTAN